MLTYEKPDTNIIHQIAVVALLISLLLWASAAHGMTITQRVIISGVKVRTATQSATMTKTPTQTATRSRGVALEDTNRTEKIKIHPSKMQVAELVCQYFTDDCVTAQAVFMAESGLRCGAVGDGSLSYYKDGIEYGKSYGVAQIRHLPGRPAPDVLLDCESNVRYAHRLYLAQGWRPWSAYTNGSYYKFISHK